MDSRMVRGVEKVLSEIQGLCHAAGTRTYGAWHPFALHGVRSTPLLLNRTSLFAVPGAITICFPLFTNIQDRSTHRLRRTAL